MTRACVLGTFAALALLAGCDGPREDAGEKADANAGVVSSEDTTAKGPAERADEAQDRVARTAADAREARADAAEDQADVVRSDADRKADALEDQAKAARAQADSKADALDDRAAATRGK